MFRANLPSRAARAAGAIGVTLLLGACSMAGFAGIKPLAAHPVAVATAAPVPETRPELDEQPFEPFAFAAEPARSSDVDGLIGKYAALYNVPESLIRRVVARESGFNPAARNGPYYGLMQIRHDTATTMGYRGGPSGLLDAETNLKYAVKYLRGAYLVANYNSDQAIRYYARGYYYDAKRMGLLEEIGLR